MARKFLTSIDLAKNELQNAVIQNLAANPSSPVLGQVYFNTAANEMRIYNGTEFEAIGLNGVTASAAEINILDGATLTTTELNYVDGVTSAIQTQLDTKSPSNNPTFTGTVFLDTGVNLVFEGATANSFETTLSAGDATDDRTVTLPDISGTVIVNVGAQTLEAKRLVGSQYNRNVVDTNTQGTMLIQGGNYGVEIQAASDGATFKTWAFQTDGSLAVPGNFIFEGATTDNFETTLAIVDPTADRTIYLPDANGTLARVENKLHDFALATSSVDLNNQKVTNLADPVDPQDAANKRYVDSAVAGLNWKQAAHLIALTNVPLTGNTGTVVIDSHSALGTGEDGYRILLTGQTTGTENGIYVYDDNGTTYTLTRPTDSDTYQELVGASIFIMEGTVYGSTSWVQSNHYLSSFASQDWAQFSGASTYTAGNGLTADGNIFNVGAGDGILSQTNAVAIDRTVVVTKYAANVGDGTNTSYTITHNLNTRDVIVSLYDNASPYAEVMADVEHSTTNSITLLFSIAPTTDKYRVVVHA